MKRDMDLVRAILLKTEAQAAGQRLGDLSELGHDPMTLTEHVWLLKQANLVEASFPGNTPTHGVFMILRLTPDGHDFLAHAQQSALWIKAKEAAGKIGVGITVAVMKRLLAGYADDAITAVLNVTRSVSI